MSGDGRSSKRAVAWMPSMRVSAATRPGSCASQVTVAPGMRESTS